MEAPMETQVSGIKALLYIPTLYVLLLGGIILTAAMSLPGLVCGFLPLKICEHCSDKRVSW